MLKIKMDYAKMVVFAIIECAFHSLAEGRFNPELEVTSCTQNQLKLTVRGAADGGIVYIQGPSNKCRQYTHTNVSEHIFDVHACAVTWHTTFRVIVQRHSLYQTGEDKQIPVTCIPDTSDLAVGNNVVNVLDKDDDEAITKTVRPSATMFLYRDGADVNGKQVRLTDHITMVIQLDDEQTDDFDIQAVDCYGGDIQIIKDGCPVDTYLFPKFTSNKQGKLQATFGVFRPTKLTGGIVSMAFSCTLKVYLGRQIPTACDDIIEMNAKHKRKLQANSGTVDEIFVGSSLQINTEDVATASMSIGILTRNKEQLCIQKAAFIVVVVLFVLYIIFTLLLYFCVHRKNLKTKRSHLRAKDRYIRHLTNIIGANEQEIQQMTDEFNYHENLHDTYSVRNCPSDNYYP